MFYTYVIRSKKDGKWYTGSTQNLRKRFKEHNNNKIFSTKGRGPFELVYYEACANEQDARMREKYLKSGFGKRHLKNRLKRFLSPTGFTVLEAMVALVILSLALLALLRVLPVGIKGSKLAEETTIATMLAQKKIEEKRAGTWPPTGGSGNFVSENYPNFEYDLVVSDPGISNLRTVDVSIYWPAPLGDPGNRSGQRCVGIKTYVANYNP